MPKINIIQTAQGPSKNILSQEICKLSDSLGTLLSSGLNEKAIVVLLQDSTGIPKKKILSVMQAIGQLRADYTHE